MVVRVDPPVTVTEIEVADPEIARLAVMVLVIVAALSDRVTTEAVDANPTNPPPTTVEETMAPVHVETVPAHKNAVPAAVMVDEDIDKEQVDNTPVVITAPATLTCDDTTDTVNQEAELAADAPRPIKSPY